MWIVSEGMVPGRTTHAVKTMSTVHVRLDSQITLDGDYCKLRLEGSQVATVYAVLSESYIRFLCCYLAANCHKLTSKILSTISLMFELAAIAIPYLTQAKVKRSVSQA